MKKKRLILITALLLLFTTTLSASAANGLSEIYWMTSTSSGGSGIGEGGTALIESSLRSMGYTTNRYQDTNAFYVRQAMSNDTVFAIVSHGAEGRIACDDGTTISAKTVLSDDKNYSLEAYFNNLDFNSMKFAYYGACSSAGTDSEYGNLLSYTTSTLGASSALGFHEIVYDPEVGYFEETLFKRLARGDSVSLAASAAKLATYNNYDGYGEVDSYQIYGNGLITIN